MRPTCGTVAHGYVNKYSKDHVGALALNACEARDGEGRPGNIPAHPPAGGQGASPSTLADTRKRRGRPARTA